MKEKEEQVQRIESGASTTSPMCDAEYVGARGARCPSCGTSAGLRGEEVTIDAGAAYQRVGCETCGGSWSDRYRLVGYSDLDGGIDHAAIRRVVDVVENRNLATEDPQSVRAAIDASMCALGIELHEIEIDVALSVVRRASKLGTPEIEFAFDSTVAIAIRVKAKSRQEAEERIREAFCAADCNGGAWPNGDPITFEASVNNAPLLMFQVDGEDVDDSGNAI
ncbi:hypothetical protein ACN8ZM_39810 (plasmid) [Burkholderia aenigmatica]|uniref:hypothetical protein n=1 Tax=Burkholderia aenigmatica TaxID=2015348 RepID=UPI003B43D3FE